jgi:hypothetical protein
VDGVRAALAAAGEQPLRLDVLINGNRLLSEQTAALLTQMSVPEKHTVRVWFIAFGDKAHAWNEYLHRIWQPSDMAFFIDGYVQVRPDAFELVRQAFDREQLALCVTGVPSVGRSADFQRRKMLASGGLQGNFHAIRGSAMGELRAAGFRLPLGLYRTDSLIGAVLMFHLDPAKNQWDPRRVYVQDGATWNMAQTPWWYPSNLKGHFKRKLRQAQGLLENQAVRQHLSVARALPQSMPRTVNELVNGWTASDPALARSLYLKNPLILKAARALRRERDFSAADRAPQLMGTAAGA